MSTEEEDPVVISEVVKIDGGDVKFERAEFAAVVFHNIAEFYPEDAHIECKYTVTSDLVPTTRDWVGLYKVGWMFPRDYLYYEWAPVPKNYKVGCDADSSVMFPAHQLPKDDGEFYQFCYVSSSGQIRGASTPFQFRRPGAEDYIEIEDEDTNMMVIRSKTVFLEESLQKAEAQKCRMQESQEALQKERDEVVARYKELKDRFTEAEAERKDVKAELLNRKAELERSNQEAKDLTVVIDELTGRIEKLKLQQATLEETITHLRGEITELKATVAKLTRQKDELQGQTASQEEQINMYKEHFSTWETKSDSHNRELTEMQVQLAQKESLIDHLKSNIDTLNQELDENRQNLDKQTAQHLQEKDQLSLMDEQLRNNMDMLKASEESKEILQKEIATYTECNEQLSKQLERSKTECEGLKHKLCTLEEDFTQKNRILTSEMDQTRLDLLTAIQEKEKVQEENGTLRQQLSSQLEISDIKVGSMSVMKNSLNQIKERLEKKEKLCRSLEKTLRTREHEFMQREHDLRREVEDLKEKIFMCSEEYKTLYIEKNKLARKLEKIANKKKTRQLEKQAPVSPTKENELPQTSTPAEQLDADSMTQEMVRNVEDFEAELERRLEKKLKYKNMYMEEREKNEQLRKQREDESAKKEKEMELLRKQVQNMPSQQEYKVLALEKCVNEKEKQIEELNQKLRQANQGKADDSRPNSQSASNNGASPLQRSLSGPSDSKYPQLSPMGCMYPYYSPYTGNSNGIPQWNGYYPAQGPMQYPAQRPQQYPAPEPLKYPHPGQLPYPYPQCYPRQQLPGEGSDAEKIVYPDHNQLYPPEGAAGRVIKTNDKHPIQRVQTDTLSAAPLPGEAKEMEPDILDVPGDNAEALDEPLKPLPAPLNPEVLPSAKKVAVMSAFPEFEPISNKMMDVFGETTERKVPLPSDRPASPMAAQGHENKDEKEKFYDAEGPSMKLCPVCSKSFSADIDDVTFEQHQLSHITGLCPVCHMMRSDEMTDEDFERHVNKHYEAEEQ